MMRLAIVILSLFSSLVFAAPKSDLWSYWNTSDEQSQTSISHQAWQEFLDLYLQRDGDFTLVKYQDVTKQDKQRLKGYISTLAAQSPRSLSKAEQYAYWVNLYNSLTVDLILDNYPLKSITKLGGLFSFGPWGDDIIKVDEKTLTLNDIEHRILRPIWNDPRTHYAVNCASLGCPNLLEKAFTADNSETLLNQAAKNFINSDKGVLISENESQLSSIYDWFAVDFGDKDKLLNHFKQYRSDLPSSLKNLDYQYDWSLNEAKK